MHGLTKLAKVLCVSLVIGGGQSLFAWTPGTNNPAAVQGFTVDTTVRNDVLSFFNCVYDASENFVAEMAWSGTVSATAGVAGTTSAIFKDDVRRRINFYRALVSMPADIAFDATECGKDQDAALMFSRNGDILHAPPVTWLSYTATGFEAAGKSNLAIGFNINNYGPAAIDGYMRDVGTGNEPVGHRRWLIYSQAKIMGTGDIPLSGTFASANATWVVENFKPSALQQFVPWPNSGYTPLPLVPARWSLTYPGADFSHATVSMTKSGTAVSVQIISANTNGYGDNTIIWEPAGMPPASINSDTACHVSVSGIQGAGVPSSYSYTVTLFDPDALNDSVAITGTSAPYLTGADYTFNSIPWADSMNLQVSTGSTAAWTEGAEDAPTPQIQAVTTGTYAPRQTVVKQTGAKAFQLTFPDFVDQSFLITRSVIPTSLSNLVFYECYHYVTKASRLSAEISTDDGITWTEVWGRNGSGSWDGTSAFNSHSISLVGYAGTPVLVRFIFRPGDSSYIGQDSSTGVFIDDITITNGTQLVNTASTNLSGTATSFTLDANTAGAPLAPGISYYLRIRPSVGLRWYGFGAMKIVKTYESNPVTGSLQATILPVGAVGAGAMWQVDGGVWQGSGATVSGLSVGSHAVAFSTVNGWATPVNQTVTVNANQTTTPTGTYATNPITGSLQVTILPADAVGAGAMWQVDGGAWQRSGATVSGLSVGSHTVAFSTVNGWAAPGSQVVVVNANLTTTPTGSFTPEAGRGSYNHDFTGALPLWDISGSYSGDVGSGIGLDFSIIEDSSGKITGSGSLKSDDGSGNVMIGNATISGAVKSSGTVTRVSITVLATGTGTVSVGQTAVIHNATFTETIKLNGEIDGASGQLTVTGGSASARLLDLTTGKKLSKSTKIGAGAALALPDDVTGSWSIILNLSPNGAKYTGSATVRTSPGGTAAFAVTGSYESKTGESKITLKGIGGNLYMVILTPGANMTVQSVKGKLFGQSLKFKSP